MKKILTLLIPVAAALPLLISAEEQQADVGAEVILRQAILISQVQNIDYGILEFDSADPGGDVVIDTDGVVAVGTTGYIDSGSPNAGSLTIVASAGDNLNIACENSAILALNNDPSKLLNLSAVTYKHAANTVACAGTANPQPIVSSGTDVVTVGATLQVEDGASAVAGSYSTGHTGGQAMTFTVSYQ